MTPIIPLELRMCALAVLSLFLWWVIRLIRRQRLSLRASLAWVLTTLLAILLTLFPRLLVSGSALLGIHVPSNAFFAAGLLYLALNGVSATIALSSMTLRTCRLTQECALLRAEVEQLRREVAGVTQGPGERST